jgi:hypothetical protein
LANGTDCTCRGLYWANPADQQAALAAIARAMPGDIVDVPPPTAVIVSLDHLTVKSGDEACTLQPGSEDTPAQVLVPILQGVHGYAAKVRLCSVEAALRNMHNIEISASAHPVQLLFAATDFALQGKTKKKIIMSFASRTFHPHHTVKSVYVIASRVTTAEGLRILPCPPDESIWYLANLRHQPALHAWNYGYDDDGVWCPERCNAAFDEADNLMTPRPRAKRRAPLAQRKLASATLHDIRSARGATRDTLRRCKNKNCTNTLDTDDGDPYCDECNTRCFVCNGTEDEGMLICDGSEGANGNHGAHIECLGLSAVPEDDWYCDACQAHRHDAVAALTAKEARSPAPPGTAAASPPRDAAAPPPTRAQLRSAHAQHYAPLTAAQTAHVNAALSQTGPAAVVNTRDNPVFTAGAATALKQNEQRADASPAAPTASVRRGFGAHARQRRLHQPPFEPEVGLPE